MALLEVMQMSQADLEYLTTHHNGAIGASGTSTFSQQCDNVRVHCVYNAPPVVQIKAATPQESPSGYKLVMGSCEFAIGLEVSP